MKKEFEWTDDLEMKKGFEWTDDLVKKFCRVYTVGHMMYDYDGCRTFESKLNTMK